MLPTPRPIRALAASLIVLIAVLGVIPGAAAQDAGGFYAGKTITLTIGAARDSDDDIYARLFAKYLARHLAGKPAVVVANLPASGGHAAAAFIFSAAAKDGTAIGAVPADVIAAPLWFGAGKVAHDPTQFIYLGSAAPESTDCFVRSDTPVMSLRDAFVSEVAVGAAADGGPTRDGPALFNSLLGTKFRIVARYGGVADILAAIEDGEVTGACGLAWTSVATRHPDWLPKGVLRGLVQESLTGADMATRRGIPLVTEFLQSGADREVLALAYAEHGFAHPLILPPGTPPERVAALRKAFMAAWQDAGLATEAKQASLPVHPVAGEEVAALVDRLYAAPAESIERVRAALAGEKVH
jgi:tripartite-type tricarboxylate transporter receptor subunit TctC